jgi:hypothetical protein
MDAGCSQKRRKQPLREGLKRVEKKTKKEKKREGSRYAMWREWGMPKKNLAADRSGEVWFWNLCSQSARSKKRSLIFSEAQGSIHNLSKASLSTREETCVEDLITMSAETSF